MPDPTQSVADAVSETIHELALIKSERGEEAAVEVAASMIAGATVFIRTTRGPPEAVEVLRVAASHCAKPPTPESVRPTHPAPKTRN